MEAYILTGGEGTRVKELTDKYNCRKHEIPILGRPFIKYMEEWLGRQPVIDCIRFLSQPHVGTGGAIKLMEHRYSAVPQPHFPFLLVYGDCYSAIDVGDLYEEFLMDDSDMVIVTRLVDDPDYGLIEGCGWRERNDQVRRYTRYHQATPPYITNIGTYMVGERAYEYIRNYPWQSVDGYNTLSLEHNILNDIFGLLRIREYNCIDLPYYDVGTPDRVESTGVLMKEMN